MLNKNYEQEYINTLLYPKKFKHVKLFSIGTPTIMYNFHSSINLRTGNNGDFIAMFNPFYLDTNNLPTVMHNGQPEQINYTSTFFFNRNPSQSQSYTLTPSNINQNIMPIYSSYRLVSGCVTLKNYGELTTASGILGGAILNKSIYRIGFNAATFNRVINTNMFTYKFNDIMKSPFYYETHINNGLQMNYFPLDNNFLEFKKIGAINNIPNISSESNTSNEYFEPSFWFCFFCYGAPLNQYLIKCDIDLNFECIIDPSYLQYISPQLNTNYFKCNLNKLLNQYKSKIITSLN